MCRTTWRRVAEMKRVGDPLGAKPGTRRICDVPGPPARVMRSQMHFPVIELAYGRESLGNRSWLWLNLLKDLVVVVVALSGIAVQK